MSQSKRCSHGLLILTLFLGFTSAVETSRAAPSAAQLPTTRTWGKESAILPLAPATIPMDDPGSTPAGPTLFAEAHAPVAPHATVYLTRTIGGVNGLGNLKVTVYGYDDTAIWTRGAIGVTRDADGSGTWHTVIYDEDADYVRPNKGSRIQYNDGAYNSYYIGYYDITVKNGASTMVANDLVDSNTIRTVWNSGSLRITQTLTYHSDDAYITYLWAIQNIGATTLNDVRFVHGQDTCLGGDGERSCDFSSDNGAGFWLSGHRAIGVRRTEAGVETRITLYGITPPYAHESADYNNILFDLSGSLPNYNGALTNEVNANEGTDNGYALEWRQTSLATGAVWTIDAIETFRIQPFDAVLVNAPALTQIPQGNAADLNYIVTNDGATDVSVALAVSQHQTAWTATLQGGTPRTVPGSGSITVTVRVTPTGASIGDTGVITLTADSNGSPPNSSDKATVRVTEGGAGPGPTAPTVTSPISGTTINDPTPTFIGAADAGTTLTVTTHPTGTVLCVTTADPSTGAWSCTSGVTLPDGDTTMAVIAGDGAGNESDPTYVDVTIDTVAPPAPTVTAPISGTTTSDSTPAFEGTSEPGALITVTLEPTGTALCTTVTTPSGHWTCTPTMPLPEGAAEVHVVAGDSAGNESDPTPVTVTVDTTAPSDIPLNVPDNRGVEFWLAFPLNHTGADTLQLLITSHANTTGTVAIPGLGFSQVFTVTAGQLITVAIPAGAEINASDAVQNNGIHVTAAQEVTVYGLTFKTITAVGVSADAYLGLPADVLATDYLVLGYEMDFNVDAPGSQFALVGTQNGTTVVITPTADTWNGSVGRLAGEAYQITLNQGQTYLLYADQFDHDDLTGTPIHADKPIAVFGGNRCANIPFGYEACDTVVEQLPPTRAWGKEFATVPLASRSNGDTLRILAAQDDTSLWINGTEVPASLARGAYYEDILTARAHITATKPVLVAQYSNGQTYDGTHFDPFMMLIPPFEQFQGGYVVNTPANGFPRHYFNVVAPSHAITDVFLDGAPITTTLFQPIGAGRFSGAQVSVTQGTHLLTGTLPFGVFTYGFVDYGSYGYPGGSAVGPIADVATLTLTLPPGGGLNVGARHCISATVNDTQGSPSAGVRVDFDVTGVHPQQSFGVSDAQGQAPICYTGAQPGFDTIVASMGTIFDTASVQWIGAGETYTLTLAKAGTGDGVVTPTVGAHSYASGTVVTLGATPDAGSAFDGWSGAVGGTANSITVTMDANKVVTATFSANASADLAVSQSWARQGMTLTYTLVARNLGPGTANGAVISDVFPAGVTWTCVASGGAACTASGTSNLLDTLTAFPASGVVTYTARNATLLFVTSSNTVAITPPLGVTDPVLSNNTATLNLYGYTLPIIFKNGTQP